RTSRGSAGMAGGQLGSRYAADRMAKQAGRFRLGDAAMAKRMVRARIVAWPGARGGRRIRQRWCGRRGKIRSSIAGSSDAAGTRNGSPEEEFSPSYSHRGRYVVPVLQ